MLSKISGLGNITEIISILNKIHKILDKIFTENTKEELTEKYNNKGVKAKIDFEDTEIFVLVRAKRE